MVPTILWQGDRIRCMKSARTLQCKICMMERKEILSRFRNEKTKIMNDNSDIYSSCKCMSRFHTFTRTISPTLKTRLAQKKVNSTRHSKTKRSRFSFNLKSPRLSRSSTSPILSQDPESPFNESLPMTPRIKIDTNVPGLPYRSPSIYPSNLERAQYNQYRLECTVET